MNPNEIHLNGIKRKRTPWVVTILLILLVVLSILFFILWNGNFYGGHLPDATVEQIKTFTPLAPLTISGATPPQAEVAIVTPVPTKQKDPAAPSVCGQSGVMDILLLGIDEHAQSDVIRILQVNFSQEKILVLSIPRDFWVPIPDMSQHNITEGRINAAYGYGEYFNGHGQGIVESSHTITANYGINFDRYVVFYYSDVIEIIDLVGGVDVNLPGPIGGYDYSGVHHFDGKAALDFAQVRDLDNDDYRIDRQSVIINAVYQKMILPENLAKIPGLGIKLLGQKTIQTDFSLKDVYLAACLAKAVGQDSMIFKDIPNNLFTAATSSSGGYIRIPSPAVTTYIQDLIISQNY
jgi:LCP family protein required for cell wall assembly